MLVFLLVLLCFMTVLFYISFYTSGLVRGLFNIMFGILNSYLSIVVFINAKLKKIESDYKVVAIVMFICGLEYIYSGIYNLLRFLN